MWLRGDGGEARQHVLCTLVMPCPISPCSPARPGSSSLWSGPAVWNAREPASPMGRKGQPPVLGQHVGPSGRGLNSCRAGAGGVGQRKERGNRTYLHPSCPYPLLSWILNSFWHVVASGHPHSPNDSYFKMAE